MEQKHAEDRRRGGFHRSDLRSAGRLHHPETVCIECIGARAGNDPVDDADRSGGRIGRNQRDLAGYDGLCQIEYDRDQKCIEDIRIGRIAAVQYDRGEDAVQSVPQSGAESQQQSAQGNRQPACSKAGYERTADDGKRDAEHFFCRDALFKNKCRYDQYDRRSSVEKRSRDGDFCCADRGGIARGEEYDAEKAVREEQGDVFPADTEHGAVLHADDHDHGQYGDQQPDEDHRPVRDAHPGDHGDERGVHTPENGGDEDKKQGLSVHGRPRRDGDRRQISLEGNGAVSVDEYILFTEGMQWDCVQLPDGNRYLSLIELLL